MNYIFGLCAVVAFYVVVRPHDGVAAVDKSEFVVHEWGTFTSMQGANGMVLEGLHHEEEALPAFVHNLHNGPEPQINSVGKGGMRAVRVTQKMETPVIYFYSDKAMDVDVQVRFRSGIVSEWYPSAARHEANYHRGDVVDMGEVRESSINWEIELIPHNKAAPTQIPVVKDDNPWTFARDVGAAYVKNRTNNEAEHYLFYRGLGAQRLPVRIEAKQDGTTTVINGGRSAMPAAFLLEYGPQGARWTSVGQVDAEAKKSASLSGLPLRDGKIVVSELRTQLKNALVKSGLFEDEALAMVRTWSRSWFSSEGTRLIYVLPRQLTDNLLPIKITPKPDKLVRTLVGRLEYITPATATEVEIAVRNRYSSNRKLERASIARLGRLGRFQEPHLRNLLAVSTDQKAKANAKLLLQEIASGAAGRSK